MAATSVSHRRGRFARNDGYTRTANSRPLATVHTRRLLALTTKAEPPSHEHWVFGCSFNALPLFNPMPAYCLALRYAVVLIFAHCPVCSYYLSVGTSGCFVFLRSVVDCCRLPSRPVVESGECDARFGSPSRELLAGDVVPSLMAKGPPCAHCEDCIERVALGPPYLITRFVWWLCAWITCAGVWDAGR